MTAPNSIASLVMFVINNGLWYQFFANGSHIPYSVPEILGFFIIHVWLVPLAFFISLSFGDNVLPYKSMDANSKPAQKQSSLMGWINGWRGKKVDGGGGGNTYSSTDVHSGSMGLNSSSSELMGGGEGGPYGGAGGADGGRSGAYGAPYVESQQQLGGMYDVSLDRGEAAAPHADGASYGASMYGGDGVGAGQFSHPHQPFGYNQYQVPDSQYQQQQQQQYAQPAPVYGAASVGFRQRSAKSD
eukprot:CAMPEP_0175158968 /NCGR_PEP_ID=MMETSP0087-20121206/23132_1 /TAXON_ID=136419 /ORGANISM="Unknown Unknown, Strain D1" /LENGTH=242 /DNA_ID=CAMNT_0016446907 /DNA_START=217 /DNA_END=945 /DNA_ORIENTATION=-